MASSRDRTQNKRNDHFDAHFSDLASFYDPSSKRRKLSGIVKSPIKAGTSKKMTRSPRNLNRRILPMSLERDPAVLKNRSVSTEVVAKPSSQVLDVNENEKDKKKLRRTSNLEKEIENVSLDDSMSRNLEVDEREKFNQAMTETQVLAEDETELQRITRLRLAYEREASVLRRKMEFQTRKFDKERMTFKVSESELKVQLEEERKSQKRLEERGYSANLFLQQDLQVLRETVKKRENEVERLSQIVSDQSQNVTVLQVRPQPEAKEEPPLVRPEPEPGEVPVRRVSLLGANARSVMSVRSFCLTSSSLSSDLRTDLLVPTSEAGIRRSVSSTLRTLTSSLTQSSPNTGDDLLSLEELTGSLRSLVSSEDQTLICESCCLVLERMAQSRDCSSLQTLLSLLLRSWTPHQDSLLTTVISNVSILLSPRDLMISLLHPDLVRTVFQVMALASSSSQHFQALCRGETGNCPLEMISSIRYNCCRAEHAVEEAACSGLTSWLLTSQRMSPGPPWTDNSCRSCTNEVIRNLVLLVQAQVQRVVTHQHSLHLLKETLESAVVVMKRYQDQLGVDVWLGQFDQAASTGRKYYWLVEKMCRMSLDDRTLDKLNDLNKYL